MSEGDVKPPTNPVVAEAHEVDTYRELREKRNADAWCATY